MFRSRDQTLAIKAAAFFPNEAGPDKLDGRHRMSARDRSLPPPDLNDREHGEDHPSRETDGSSERSVGCNLIHERSTEHST